MQGDILADGSHAEDVAKSKSRRNESKGHARKCEMINPAKECPDSDEEFNSRYATRAPIVIQLNHVEPSSSVSVFYVSDDYKRRKGSSTTLLILRQL